MNLKIKKTSLIATFILACINQVDAAEINIESLIGQKVLDKTGTSVGGPYFDSLYISCLLYRDREGSCLAAVFNDSVPPKISDVRLYNPEVEYSGIKQQEIPETVELEYYSVKNCTSTSRSLDQEVTLTVTESNSITVADRFTSSTNANLEAGLDIKLFSLGGSASETKTIDITETNSSSTSTTKVIRETIKEDVEPHTALIFTIDKRYSNAYINFTVSFLFDANLKMHLTDIH